MSSWSCYSGSNNIHFNYPPIMSDGRNFAEWQPEAVINNNIQQKENIKSNWDYRRYMQKNGLEIMKFNSLEACNDLGISPYTQTNTTSSLNTPYLYKNTFDSWKPSYGYSNSDLKTPYLSREQLNARLISPSIQTSGER